MAETLLEQQVCGKCGADVRKGALFCYHCGGAVASEVAVSAANGDSVSSGWFRENIAQEETAKTTTKLDETVTEKIDKPIEKPSDEPIEKPKIVEEAKLKSAAAMRRKAKIVQKKRVEEIEWAEHENAPNVWFLLVALILILIVAGFFFLAVFVLK
jgi:hypothetical protein